jgi:uncharacterized protein with von Willebrand factor type A (vWA) domain
VADLPDLVAAFGRRLHDAGVPVTPERSALFARSIVLTGPTRVNELYWLGRLTLLVGHGQQPAYDIAFGQVFGGGVLSEASLEDLTTGRPGGATGERDDSQEEPSAPGRARTDVHLQGGIGTPLDEPDPAEPPAALPAIGDVELLAEQHFAACSPEELALLSALVERLPVEVPTRRSRRTRRHAHGRRVDVRATLRRASSTAGDPVHVVRRRRRARPRRVVLIADVSGSMQPYSRVYLHLMRGAVRALHAEAFVFATRLTRLTRVLGQGRPDEAYAAVGRAAQDWSGGTRIGEALTSFLDDHGRRGLARGAVVVIVSDGWELGDPEVLAEAMRRLGRLAHHVIWVNPRLAASGYEPLVGGMAAALPYVGTFVSGHSLRAVEDVLLAIRGGGSGVDGVPAP